MANKAGAIAENTVEDFIDDGTSNLVYAIGNCYFGHAPKNKKCDKVVDSAFDEALEGATQTLKFSVMNAVIYSVSAYLMPRLLAGSTVIFGYVKGSRIIKKLKKGVSSKLKGNRGSKLLKKITSVLFGTQEEILAMSGMANNNLNNLTTVISTERQTQINKQSYQRKQLMQTLDLNVQSKGLNDNKKIEAYHFKMKTGTWTTSTADKNLFRSVVPKEYIQDTFSFNSAFIEKLNSHTQYAKSLEGKIINIAQAQVDMMTNHGLSKVN